MKKDADLQALYQNEAWKKLVKNLQDSVDKIEANYDKPLQKELLGIFEDDQTTRIQFIDSSKKYGYNNPLVQHLGYEMAYKDSIDLLKIIKILDEKGWVGSDRVGRRANQTIFLVIQHADLKTQEKYLPMMREAVKKGNAHKSELALLEDRVAIREGRKQIYGSQIGTNPKNNINYILPLEDPAHVDERRAEMGLGPLADYVRMWSITWNVSEYETQLPEIEKWSKSD